MERPEDEAIRALLCHLQRPLEGLELITEVRETLTRLERLLVREARLGYSSWAEIGAVLGISRQAAHRRHGSSVNRSGGV